MVLTSVNDAKQRDLESLVQASAIAGCTRDIFLFSLFFASRETVPGTRWASRSGRTYYPQYVAINNHVNVLELAIDIFRRIWLERYEFGIACQFRPSWG